MPKKIGFFSPKIRPFLGWILALFYVGLCLKFTLRLFPSDDISYALLLGL